MNSFNLHLYIPQWQLDVQSSHGLVGYFQPLPWIFTKKSDIILCMVSWEKKFSINFEAVDLKIVEAIVYINLTPYVGLAKEGMGM